ncbi:cellobiose ABC transporter membrane protein [Leifsonia sp. 98AMF]|uniref:carbohydrate ABC transporter permease n=1 Tax=unclassified Leifsonia TaxID=2663824 RepID=UPI00087B5329|nr:MULTISPECIES: sugar ABC transporter permease [unclassified Leifsonia]SDH73693.1 cellobiose ABC transporter membrane protein [Leifsonia sp. 197AMF]SDJ48327.1 cellobiose ABC transporter membrane protein [Leifsonia sp. 466MF]SDK26774.1 cellobiose ABC transporter membrane protein [Leifsonia sp. 157MF]SDN68130.1 cellobiose ABC transporter membrane protein [Leifsonia sp. 509MF]SEN40172.1 cellobiose ABC transporter membrane protein [Leifsonia sp. 467MF]
MTTTAPTARDDAAGAAAPAASPRRGRAPRADLNFKQRLSRFDVKASPYFYIAPFFILFGLVGLFPLVYTFVVSLNNWNLLTGPGEWVGFKNYAAELSDPFFWNSLFNTISIFLLSAIPQLIAAVFIAAILDQNIRAKTFWRMSVLLPYVVTPVAVTLIFSSAFDEKYGLINNMLQAIGLDPVMWKTQTFPSHVAIASMVNWRWTGYNALILLAAMQAVPRDIHESAALDGAGSFRRFFSITLPSIRPTMIFVIITATIGGLQIFTEPKLFNPSSAVPGGPQRQYQTTVLYLWDMAFNRQNFGKASAIAWLLFLLIVVFGVLNFLISRRIASTESRLSKKRTAKRLQASRILAAASEEKNL